MLAWRATNTDGTGRTQIAVFTTNETSGSVALGTDTTSAASIQTLHSAVVLLSRGK